MTTERNSSRPLEVSTSYQYIVDGDCGEKNEEYCLFSARKNFADIGGRIGPPDAEALPREFTCLEVPEHVDVLPKTRFQFELTELDLDLPNSKGLEVEAAKKQQYSVNVQSHASGEGICSTNESPRKGDKGLNSGEDCEICWEDLHLREEIGQGKA